MILEKTTEEDTAEETSGEEEAEVDRTERSVSPVPAFISWTSFGQGW